MSWAPTLPAAPSRPPVAGWFAYLTNQLTGIPSGEAFGTLRVAPAQNLFLTGIATAQAFGLLVAVYVQNISLTGIASSEAFGGSAAQPGAVTVSPQGIATAQAVGTPTVTRGAVAVTPAGIPSAEAFGTVGITTGPISVALSAIPSSEAFGALASSYVVGLTGIPSEASVGALALAYAIHTTGIPTGEVFGTPNVVGPPQPIQLAGIPSAEAFGGSTLQPGPVAIGMQGIASAGAMGAPVVTVGPVNIALPGIGSAEAFGALNLQQNVVLGGIASAESFGAMKVAYAVALPSGIASAEAFGTSTITTGSVNVTGVGGIASAEAFGADTVAPGAVSISTTGIATAEAFGMTTVVPPVPPDQPVFDAVSSATLVANTVASWTHTAASGAYVLVYVDNPYPNGSGSTSVTYDGVAMTLLASVTHHVGVLSVFGLPNAPGGAKTVAVTPAGGYANGIATAVSYSNVASIELPATTSGYGYNLSQGPVALNGKKLVVQAFGTGATLGTMRPLDSLAGGTNRFNGNVPTYTAMSISDSTVDGTTFTANNGTAAENVAWASVTIVLSPITLSYVGAGANNGNTITIPAHNAGDLILIHAYRNGSTAVPTQPTAAVNVPTWNIIDNPTGASSCSNRTAWAIGTGTTTSGTWTNATSMNVIVVRGQRANSPIGGHVVNGATATNQTLASAITPLDVSGVSIFVQFYGLGNGATFMPGFGASAPPTGYTNRANTGTSSGTTHAAVDTKNVTTSDGGVTRTANSNFNNMGYRGAQVEILN